MAFRMIQINYRVLLEILLEGLHVVILGIVEFPKVARNFLEGLHEVILGIVEFHKVARNFL